MPLDPDALAEVVVQALDTVLGSVLARVAALEARPPVPGPPGPAGQPGVTYRGVYQDGQAYAPGDLVTWAGSMWHCNEATTFKPGDGLKVWTLMVKRGRDGKDGKATQ